MRTPTIYHYNHLAAARRFAGRTWQELDAVISAEDTRQCRTHEPDAYFPSDGTRFAGRQALQAERARIAGLCRGCPVRLECLAGALLRGETYGSWGGVCQPDYQMLQQLWEQRVQPAVPPPAGSAAVKETR